MAFGFLWRFFRGQGTEAVTHKDERKEAEQRLQVHQPKLRSQAGGDEEQNSVTLCTDCYARMHQPS